MSLFTLPLICSALLLALFNESQEIFLLTALAGSVSAIYGSFLLLSRLSLVKFTNIMALSLLLGYAVGTIVFVFGSLFANHDLNLTYTAFRLHISQSDLSVALMFVYLACAILFWGARVERPIFESAQAVNVFTLPKVRLFIWAGATIVFSAFAMGDLGYMGIQVSELGNITPLGSISFLLAPIFLPITVLCLRGEKIRWRRIFLLMASGLFLLVLFPLGRRVLLYSSVLVLIALSVSSARLPNYSKKKWILMSFVGGCLFFVAYSGFQFFYALRLSAESMKGGLDFNELIRGAFDALAHESSKVSSNLANNIIERPFILSYLAAFVGAQATYSPLWGEELLYAMEMAIPSLLFAQKTSLLPQSPEEFVHPAFGFYVFDGPNSIVTAGLNDFGFIGILLYPMLLVAVYIAVRHLLISRIPMPIYYMVMFRLIYQLLYVEQSLAGLLTVGLRDIALLAIIASFIWKMPVFRLFSPSYPANQGRN